VAAGFGVRLDEAADAGCCGHPSRGAVASLFETGERVFTACPACDASLAENGVETVPLWNVLTERTGRDQSISLAAAGDRFVPYVGCLADRDAALTSLGDAAEQSGAAMLVDYPTLHNGCCGALGGMYRGATKSSARLLEFAARQQAPVVTTCVLCRDNLRSAARELKLAVPVRFWPEFFRAVPAGSAAAGAPAGSATVPTAPQERADA
jgi:Fe-S oxidoreductase